MYVSTSGRGQRAAQNDRIHCPNEQVFPDIYYLLHGNCLSDLRIVSTNEVAMSVMSDNHRDKQPRRSRRWPLTEQDGSSDNR